jgi:TetR/AcrR family transcriptional repressor of nem operon
MRYAARAPRHLGHFSDIPITRISLHLRRCKIRLLLHSSPRVQRFLEEIIEDSVGDRERRGCFLVNSALEVAPHDAELGEFIADRFSEIEAFFHRSIKAAQAERTIPRDRAPRDLARLLLGVLLGIRVLARSKPSRALLEGIARPALALLD